ncbi:MAG: hypothetical protein FWB74_03230, partial [Defluviitaleaceae bacterium]|nr:hypothetical protein [Defluviitaleaceae bacterium]
HGWGFWHMTGSMPAPIRDGEVIDLAHLELILSERQWQPNAETSVTAPVLPATFRYVARIKFVK